MGLGPPGPIAGYGPDRHEMSTTGRQRGTDLSVDLRKINLTSSSAVAKRPRDASIVGLMPNAY